MTHLGWKMGARIAYRWGVPTKALDEHYIEYNLSKFFSHLIYTWLIYAVRLHLLGCLTIPRVRLPVIRASISCTISRCAIQARKHEAHRGTLQLIFNLLPLLESVGMLISSTSHLALEF